MIRFFFFGSVEVGEREVIFEDKHGQHLNGYSGNYDKVGKTGRQSETV